MRLIKQGINSDGSGSVLLCPQEPEDMVGKSRCAHSFPIKDSLQWHAYNLVRPADLLTASAIRRITTESSSTGSTSSQRVHIDLTIRVLSIEFDSQAGEVHIAGRIARENRYTKIGQHHTLDLELNRNFTVEKETDGSHGGQGWDIIARQQLADAVNVSKKAELVAIVLDEGLAHVCIVTEYQTVLRQKISTQIPRKAKSIKHGSGKSLSSHDKAVQRFFKTLLDTLISLLEELAEQKESLGNLPVLFASPGFAAANFLRYLKENSTASAAKILQEFIKRNAFVVVHSSSAYLHSLDEVMKSHEVKSRMKDAKYSRDARLMDDFLSLLRNDDGRAWYGHRECEIAVAMGAVGRGGGMLIISNALFRNPDVAVRQRWVKLVDQVTRLEGGEVRVLSSEHESGVRLEGLGGVAAILTFPVHDLDQREE